MDEHYEDQVDDQTTVVKDKAYWLNINKIIFNSSSDYFDTYIRPNPSYPDDLIDAESRIYDMDYLAPTLYEQSSCEPEVE